MTTEILIRPENTTTDLILAPDIADMLAQAVNSVLDSVSSEHTRRAYRRALVDYLAWRAADPSRRILNKANVQAYRRDMEREGKGSATINLRLSAIRKLAREVADNATDPSAMILAEAVARAEGVRHEGTRAGNWLTLAQAEALINAPDVDTLAGLRDRALLAVLIGAGIRRTEAATLTIGHIQQREGRWVIIDLSGKRRKIRSVPINAWVQAAIAAWTTRAGLTTGRLFRPVSQRDQLTDRTGMSPQVIYNIVARYAQQLGFTKEKLGFTLAAHDTRRTYAQLARKAGSSLDQISVNLGHSNIATTSRYLKTDLDLVDAPSDRIAIRLYRRQVEREPVNA